MGALQLIVGLGNPGAEYANTRHNAGCWWLDTICQNHNVQLKLTKKFNAYLAKATLDTDTLYCMVADDYMNLSGRAISRVAKYYNISPKKILIAHDDLDLPPGSVRLKNGGGSQGHNGLKDIIAALGSGDFHRLRIGIGHPGNSNLVSSYVLHAPSQQERQLIDQAIEQSILSLATILQGNWQNAMNQLHSVSFE